MLPYPPRHFLISLLHTTTHHLAAAHRASFTLTPLCLCGAARALDFSALTAPHASLSTLLRRLHGKENEGDKGKEVGRQRMKACLLINMKNLNGLPSLPWRGGRGGGGGAEAEKITRAMPTSAPLPTAARLAISQPSRAIQFLREITYHPGGRCHYGRGAYRSETPATTPCNSRWGVHYAATLAMTPHSADIPFLAHLTYSPRLSVMPW